MKKLFLLVTILFLLIAGVGSVFAQNNSDDGINWVYSYDEGYELASKTGKQVIVFITAPTWCDYCKWMDNEVLIDKELIKTVNENFIAIKVLDKIEGERNPDLNKVNFSGYPTLLFTSPEKKLYISVNAVEVDKFMDLCDFALNYDDKVKKYETNFKKAKEDGEYAVKYIKTLNEEGMFYNLCKEHGYELYQEGKLDNKQKESVLVYAIDSAFMEGDYTFVIEKSELFLEKFPKASQEHIEIVKFNKIAGLYYTADYEKALEEAKDFVEKYPDSYYTDSLNQLIDILNNSSR